MQNESLNETREKKRAQFAENAKSKSRLTPILIVLALALAGAVIYLVVGTSSDSPAATTTVSTESGGASVVKIPVGDISNQAKFFDFNAAGKQVRFFVLKSSDGVYRAAMDACDTCWHAKKGYHQEGDEMVCNNCGLKFHSARINEVSGGCNPIGLPCAVEGDRLVIKISDIESRNRYF
ncbi:MAG TPA: DUF2318 domain-containing protein [Blastocatellia bacterium]|jgi:uncharacterized membrane protein